jgi:hypothetical protein
MKIDIDLNTLSISELEVVIGLAKKNNSAPVNIAPVVSMQKASYKPRVQISDKEVATRVYEAIKKSANGISLSAISMSVFGNVTGSYTSRIRPILERGFGIRKNGKRYYHKNDVPKKYMNSERSEYMKKRGSYVGNRANQLRKTENLTKSEAMKKASDEWEVLKMREQK